MNGYVSIQAVIDALAKGMCGDWTCDLCEQIKALPVADVVEVVRCKDCKHFELDKPYVIQGVPILGHEVCNAWGDGCKTDENGWCFLAERRTDETN